MKRAAFLLALLFLAAPAILPALEVPKLASYVNDYAGILSPGTRSALEARLAEFERSDSTQIVVLTVPSLEGDAIEDFGIRVGDAWKIGQKGKDNGALLIIAAQDRRLRIEVGRGLEGKLTDLMSGRVIRDQITPRFKAGDYDGGVTSGVEAIMAIVRGEYKAEPPQGLNPKRSGHLQGFVISLLFFGFVIAKILGAIWRPLGGVPWAAGLPLAANYIVGPLAFPILGILALVGFGLGTLLGGSGGASTGGGIGRHGGFGGSLGGFGGGFGGGGGFSSGGFGGGGGGFGGGGSSGSW